MKGGSYTVNWDITATNITIHPAPTETVNISGYISIVGANTEVDGGDTLGQNEVNRIIIARTSSAQDAAPIDFTGDNAGKIIEDVAGDSAWFGGDFSTLRFSEIGPLSGCGGVQDMIASILVQDVVFEGNYAHDLTKTGCEVNHSDMMDIQFAGNSKIINNSLYNCQDQCIFNAADNQTQADAMHGLLIENNSFNNSDAIGVQCDGACEMNYNTYSGLALGSYRAGPFFATALTLTGNIFMQDTICTSTNADVPGSTVSHSYSIFPSGNSDGACGTGSTMASVTRSDNIGHIATGSYAAIAGKGNPSDCPANDIDYQTRPLGTATICDAGADEVDD